MQVYEIKFDGGDDVLKERVARMLCPDENHPPPCPVPWSFGYRDEGLVLAIHAKREAAEEVLTGVRALTRLPVTLTEGAAADHEELIEQYRVESMFHQRR